MDDSNELYIYMGKDGNHHYFSHCIGYPHKYNVSLSMKVYNSMMTANKLKGPEENVIIIEKLPNETCLTIITIQHSSKNAMINFTKNDFDIPEIIKKFSNKKEKTSVVDYDYFLRTYFWLELDSDLSSNYENICKFEIKKILNAHTRKPFIISAHT